MNKKGQAALEFLMTYGWAFLVILVMIGALAYFGFIPIPNNQIEGGSTTFKDCEYDFFDDSGNISTITYNKLNCEEETPHRCTYFRYGEDGGFIEHCETLELTKLRVVNKELMNCSYEFADDNGNMSIVTYPKYDCLNDVPQKCSYTRYGNGGGYIENCDSLGLLK